MQGGDQDPLYWSLSLRLPEADCCALFWASEVPFLTQLISQLLKEVSRMKKPFLFHSSLPGMLISSHFSFFLYFILLGYMVIFLVILVSWDLLPAFSSYSVRIVPTCRCIFGVFVGGDELQIFLFHHLDPAPLNSFLLCFFWMEVTKQQQYIKSIWSNVPFKASFLNDFLSG